MSRVTAPGAVVTQGRALRVCHLAYTFYETDNRVMRYARMLAERGHEVDVVALRRATQTRRGEDHGVRVLRVQHRTRTEGAPGTYLLKIVWFLLKSTCVLALRHLRKPYDVVHVHNVPDFLVFAAIVPRLLGAKIILDIHDVLPELYGGKFGAAPDSMIFRALLLAERLSCRFAHAVIVANHVWHERLIRRAVLRHKCSAILNYPDLEIFHPRGRDVAGARKGFRILYPGSLNRHQGLDVAIRAFAAVRDRLAMPEFHIFGDGPARAELISLAAQLGVADQVTFFDPLPMEDIAAVMASAQVGLEPKLGTGFANEALSTKILEFMASGVPVIVSRTLVHARYFDDTVVRFVPPGDYREMAAALLRLHNAPPDEAFVTRAREFATSYSWQRRAGEYEAVLESVLRPLPVAAAVRRQSADV